jgi:DNA repair ATPase RecN
MVMDRCRLLQAQLEQGRKQALDYRQEVLNNLEKVLNKMEKVLNSLEMVLNKMEKSSLEHCMKVRQVLNNLVPIHRQLFHLLLLLCSLHKKLVLNNFHMMAKSIEEINF